MSAHIGHESAAEAEVVPRLERVHELSAIEDEWDALAERSGSIFSTALWSRLWWWHFGRDRELLLHAARSADGGLTVVVPLYAWRRRLPRVVRFLGHGPGDELGPVYARGDHDQAARALGTALDELDWSVFLGEQLPGDEGWTDLLGGRTWRHEASPTLRLPGSWEEYLAGRSANFRQQLRRREEALSREGDVALRLADPATLEGDMDALFALHRARWGGAGSDFDDTPFHRELAREALGRGWLRLWLLELDGSPIAAWHGFRVGSIASYYQAGRDPTYERLSVGFVLLAHSIRSAIGEGANEYRFGRGDEAFKSRFTGDDPRLETVALTRGTAGAAAYRSARLARAVRHRVRRDSAA
jgi:CelD/BcsL family acetyltransferase involved in cellulose biosynthesis